MSDPQLEIFRKQLDALDEQLVSIVVERFKITDQIGVYKYKHNLAAIDKVRERSQIERIHRLSEEYGLDASVSKRILRILINHAVKRHKAVKGGKRLQ